MKLNPVELALMWNTMFDFPTLRRALAASGLGLTALRSRALPGWHQGVAVRD